MILSSADTFFSKSVCFLLLLFSKMISRVPSILYPRALTPLFGKGAGAHGIGKISGVLTKIGKFDIVLMYDVSIARLIPIIKLAIMNYEKRERKK